MTAYQGMIVEGYKEGAIITSDDYNTAQHIEEAACLQWDNANLRWALSTSQTDIHTVMSIDGTHDSAGTAVSGSDVAASGKVPVLNMNAMVANGNFDDGAGSDYTPLTTDVGSLVIPSDAGGTPGKWEIITAGAAANGDIFVGVIRKIETINGVVMAIHDFFPRFLAK